MNKCIYLFIPCMLFQMTAYAAVKPINPPDALDSVAEPSVSVLTRLPSDLEKFSMTSIPNTYFGVSGAKGSLSLGLLLGPLGVLINKSNVETKNNQRAMAISDIISINTAELLRSIIPAQNIENQTTSSQSQYKLVPAARINFIDDNSFYFTCIINAEFQTQDSKRWQARYTVSSNGNFSTATSEHKEYFMTPLTDCYDRAYKIFSDHVSGRMGSFKTRVLKTTDYELTLPIYNAPLPTRIIGNDGLGLIEFPNSYVLSIH